MQMCVYTTLYGPEIKYMRDYWPKADVAWFSSKRRWATASDYLFEHKTMPILFRLTDDKERPCACTYVADLVDMRYREDLGNESQRRKWLSEHRGFQRAFYEHRKSLSQFEEFEIDKMLDYTTHFAINNLRSIPRLPLPLLSKWSTNEPLSANYKYGYSLCKFPVPKPKPPKRHGRRGKSLSKPPTPVPPITPQRSSLLDHYIQMTQDQYDQADRSKIMADLHAAPISAVFKLSRRADATSLRSEAATVYKMRYGKPTIPQVDR